MSASDEMRRLIDLANTNKLNFETYGETEIVNEEGTPFKNFSKWGLNESAEEETDECVEEDVDTDAEDDDSDEGADEEELDEAVVEVEDEPSVLDQMYADHMSSMEAPPENIIMIHLLRPRGGSECGAACDETNCSPEINEITCPHCLDGHDAYEAQFGMSDEGEGEVEETFTGINGMARF